MVFDESKFARGTGAQGGQFVSKGGQKSSAIGYDGTRGSGYGSKGGDDNVKALQKALNKLGIKDAQGKPLAVDGKFGPRTTAAVRGLQKKLGIPVDGKVTPALLKRIQGLKKTTTLTDAKPAAKKAAPKKAAVPAKKTAPPMQKITPRKAAPVKRSLSYSRAMTDLERHGSHNQKSHGNRLGKPTNVAGKTGHARGAEAARVGTNDVRLDDEVEILPDPAGGSGSRGGNVGKKGRIVDLEAVRPIVELDDGRQVEVPKRQLKVTRTRNDPSLEKELRARLDSETKKIRERSDALRKVRST
jgi:peptidoglycan hydrolase-like protein with peptidoglycan-binding domain